MSDGGDSDAALPAPPSMQGQPGHPRGDARPPRDDGALADQDDSRWDGADHAEVLLGTLDVDALLQAQDQEERGTAPSLVT